MTVMIRPDCEIVQTIRAGAVQAAVLATEWWPAYKRLYFVDRPRTLSAG